MKTIAIIFILLISLLLSVSCGMFTKGDNFIDIHSDPSSTVYTIRDDDNAIVVVDTTPSRVDLFSRSNTFDEDFTITFEKEGYQSKTVSLDAQVHYWHHWRSSGDDGFYSSWSNDIFSGPTWIYPEEVFVRLKKIGIKISTRDNDQ